MEDIIILYKKIKIEWDGVISFEIIPREYIEPDYNIVLATPVFGSFSICIVAFVYFYPLYQKMVVVLLHRIALPWLYS